MCTVKHTHARARTYKHIKNKKKREKRKKISLKIPQTSKRATSSKNSHFETKKLIRHYVSPKIHALYLNFLCNTLISRPPQRKKNGFIVFVCLPLNVDDYQVH